MLQSYSPIGKFILLTYQHPDVLEANKVLQNKLENFLIILKHRVTEKGVLSTQKSIEDELFSLRFDILEFLIARPDVLKEFESIVIDQIGKKYFTKGKFKELGNAVSDSLEVYLLMFGKLTKEIGANISGIEMPQDIKQSLSLSSLRHIHSLQPNPELEVVIEWFTASVKYDFYLIASELIINKEITVDDEQIKTLTSSIRQAIVDFGTYTVLSGIWNPSAEDESALIRNIKIKSAHYKFGLGLGKSISLDNLNKLLH